LCLSFITNNKGQNTKKQPKNQILFIHPPQIPHILTRTLKQFSHQHIQKLPQTYHPSTPTNHTSYQHVAPFSKLANLQQLNNNQYILTPPPYLPLPDLKQHQQPFQQKIEPITSQLTQQFPKSKQLQHQIPKSFHPLPYPL
ncbi:N-6 DNA methylase, partial [Staphylococcus hominis]|uniref:N-6 DNA methylase n=1 Tax=Staphylococcus hominis TaxID=1290 RepID=UPI0011AA519F